MPESLLWSHRSLLTLASSSGGEPASSVLARSSVFETDM